MVTPGFVDLANVLVNSTGTGSVINLGAVITGWKSWSDAGAVNGEEYFILIEAADGSRHEISTAVYDSSVPRFTGRTVIASSEVANAPLNLTLTDRIFSGPVAERMVPVSDGSTTKFLRGDYVFETPGGSSGGDGSIVPKAADYTVLDFDNGAQFTNDTAGGAIGFTLPAAAAVIDNTYGFYVEAAQLLKITPPSTDSIAVGTQIFNPTPGTPGASSFTASVNGIAVQANSTLDRIIAVDGTSFRKSLDGGQIWASSTPGGTLVGCLFLDDTVTVLAWDASAIYLSGDFGATWTPSSTGGTPSDFSYPGCCSDDGQKITLIDNNDGSFYTSTDGGANFALAASATGFYAYDLRCDGTGDIVAIVNGNVGDAASIYISTDQAATFNPTAGQPAIDGAIYGAQISQDGQKLIINDYGGTTGFWTSPDQGATWANVGLVGASNSQYVFNQRQLGEDGAIVTAGGDAAGDFAISTDFGATWTLFSNTDFATATIWYYSAVSADGLRAAASPSSGTPLRIKYLQPAIPGVGVTIQSDEPCSYLRFKAVDTGLWAASSITGQWFVGATAVPPAAAGGGSMTVDTIADILATTPTSGAMAFATDTQQTLIADGTQWQADSYFYVQAEAPAMGAHPWPNLLGYGRDYLTDLALSNCYFGYGTGGVGSHSGEVRNNPEIGTHGALQRWSSTLGDWRSIVEGLVLQEVVDMSQAITQTPIGKTEEIVVFNGNSVALGLNGIPLYLGYVATMGAYGAYQTLSGGTF